MYVNFSVDSYIQKDMYSFLLDKNPFFPSDDFVDGFNRGFNIILNSTRHFYEPVTLFLPFSLEYFQSELKRLQPLIKEKENKGKYQIFLVHFDGGMGECFLTKESAKKEIKERVKNYSTEFPEGVKISLSTRTVFISELAEYIDEKEIINMYGNNWKEVLSEK